MKYQQPMSIETILILGMHRSGTSCLTGSLQSSGVFLGEVFTKNPYNKKGNRENAEVMKINRQVLQFNGGDWDNPPESLTWTNDHRLERDSIIESMRLEEKVPCGIKDPRLIFTLPFWQEAILNTQLVASFRHPLSVAKSLKARNDFSTDKALVLWVQYNQKLLDYLDVSPFPIICFDVEKDQYIKDLNRLQKMLNLKHYNDKTPFFDNQLRNSYSGDENHQLPEQVTNIYSRLMSHYRNYSE